MRRLCERPGCSEIAAVAYGMRAEDLVFWLDAIGEGPGPDRGVLCQRHGDSMVVPRGWTLDDLRDPHLHLFRPPTADANDSAPSRQRRAKHDDTDLSEQLALGGMVDAGHGTDDAASIEKPAAAPAGAVDAPAAAGSDIAAAEISAVPANGSDAATAVATGEDVASGAWKPNFDDADDLDGLLSAQSPLLSRAFRVNDRSD